MITAVPYTAPRCARRTWTWSASATGWSSPPTEEAEAGTSLGWTGKTVSVTLATPAYGTNTLYVAAVDSVGNVGYGSLVIQVPTP
ncbi:hypothetical protein [Micromonospora sp. NPDC005237]|uniref:hypothetical protein n=1 Tax=Micromonospora sp. NPDC005237 TaxID=3155113 RepID=UPI0033AA3CD6